MAVVPFPRNGERLEPCPCGSVSDAVWPGGQPPTPEWCTESCCVSSGREHSSVASPGREASDVGERAVGDEAGNELVGPRTWNVFSSAPPQRNWPPEGLGCPLRGRSSRGATREGARLVPGHMVGERPASRRSGGCSTRRCGGGRRLVLLVGRSRSGSARSARRWCCTGRRVWRWLYGLEVRWVEVGGGLPAAGAKPSAPLTARRRPTSARLDSGGGTS